MPPVNSTPLSGTLYVDGKAVSVYDIFLRATSDAPIDFQAHTVVDGHSFYCRSDRLDSLLPNLCDLIAETLR